MTVDQLDDWITGPSKWSASSCASTWIDSHFDGFDSGMCCDEGEYTGIQCNDVGTHVPNSDVVELRVSSGVFVDWLVGRLHVHHCCTQIMECDDAGYWSGDSHGQHHRREDNIDHHQQHQERHRGHNQTRNSSSSSYFCASFLFSPRQLVCTARGDIFTRFRLSLHSHTHTGTFIGSMI